VTSGGVRVGGMILKSEELDENTTTGRKLALRQAENQVTDEIAKTPERQAELEKAITGKNPPNPPSLHPRKNSLQDPPRSRRRHPPSQPKKKPVQSSWISRLMKSKPMNPNSRTVPNLIRINSNKSKITGTTMNSIR